MAFHWKAELQIKITFHRPTSMVGVWSPEWGPLLELWRWSSSWWRSLTWRGSRHVGRRTRHVGRWSCHAPRRGYPWWGSDNHFLSVHWAFRPQSLKPPLVENAFFTVKFQITCQFISIVKAFVTELRSNSGLKEPIWKILPNFSKI